MSRKKDVLCCIFQAVLLFCIVFGIFRCVYFVLDMEYAVSVMETVIGIFIPFSLLCSFLYYSKESAVLLVPAAAVIQCFLWYLFRKQLWVYLQCMAAAGIRVLNEYYKLSLTEWISMEKIYSDNFKEGELIFTLSAFFLFSIDIAGFFRAERAALLLGAVLFFGMCVGKFPSGFSAVIPLLGLLGLIPMSSKKKDFSRSWKLGRRRKAEISCTEQEERKEALVHGETRAACLTLGCFLPMLLICFFFGKWFGAWAVNFYTPIQEWANEMEYNIMNYDYGNLIPGIKNPFLGDRQQGILNNQKVEYTGKEILRVTVERKPQDAMYLRGFVGKDYRNNAWTEIEESDGAVKEWGAGSEKWLWRFFNNYAYTALKKKDLSPEWITIEYLDAPGCYAYLPYFSEASQDLSVENGIVKRQSRGEWLHQLRLKGFYELSNDSYAALAESVNTPYKKYHDLYYNYVYKEYRNVPDSVPRLKRLCEGRENIRLQSATEFIYRYLSHQFQYSLDLKMLPYGEDFVEYFLFTQKKGYCIHFATAAALMYRLCGIPSRYVEGYVIWPKDFKENADGTYTAVVTDKRAHAWTEIYEDGAGFVPVDMTPGNEADRFSEETKKEEVSGQEKDSRQEINRAEEKDGSGQEDNDSEDDKEENDSGLKDGQEEEENDADAEEEAEDMEKAENTQEQDGEKVSGKNEQGFSGSQTGEKTGTLRKTQKNKKSKISVYVKRLGTAAAGIVILFFFTVFCLRLQYRTESRKLLRGVSGRNRREVIKLSSRLYGYMRISGIEKPWRKLYGELSDREYERLFRERFPYFKDGYEQFQKLVQRALYASPKEDIISGREVKESRKFVAEVSAVLSAALPWYRRLFIKTVIGTVHH